MRVDYNINNIFYGRIVMITCVQLQLRKIIFE